MDCILSNHNISLLEMNNYFLRTPLFSLGLAALASSRILILTQAFSTTMSMSTSSPKRVLYDMPVSNNGARCRLILYKKKIPTSEVDIISPTTLGDKGLKSPEYLHRNPQGKMPLLSILEENGDNNDVTNIPESDTICRYLMSTYENLGPSFLPNNTKSNLIARIHDMYLTTIQGCMYKATPPFGIYQTRRDALDEYVKQLNIINDLVSDSGGYLCGEEVSLADATLFPSIVFAAKMLPKFGYENPLPDKILNWYNDVKSKDEDFAKVYDEVRKGTCYVAFTFNMK